jgi:lysophospholipase L1-like esterase
MKARSTLRPALIVSTLLLGFCLTAALAQTPAPTASPTPAGPPVEVPHADPNILYIGRWDRTNPAVAQGNWNGHYFRTKFTGSRVGIHVDAPTLLAVSIDGEPFRTVSAAPEKIVELHDKPLRGKEHTLQVGSAGQNYRVAFKGLTLEEGAQTLPPSERPLIEFIGDSITTGINANYAWMAAEMLGRNHTQIAFSGVALTDGYGCTSKTGMEVQYFRKHNYNHEKSPEEFTVPWDFSAYTPEMVVILLGQNDQCGKATPDAFVAAYKRLVSGIREKFPKAPIVMLRTLGGPYEKEIRQAWGEIHKGDPNVHHVDTTGWLAKEDFADGVHPGAGGHLKLARLLANQLESILTTTKL